MSSIVDIDADGALAGLTAAVDALSELDARALTHYERLTILREVERIVRRIPATTHGIINGLVAEHVPGQFGGTSLVDVLADTLRITRSEARRRIRDAAELAPTASLSGEPIEPVLAATATAQRAGTAGHDHIAVIRQFWDRLPHAVDAVSRAAAEKQLAGLTGTLRPDELRRAAERLLAYLDPDGSLTGDVDRARRRGFRMGRQGADLMTPGAFDLDPELRSYLDAIFAKYAAPGVCNSEGETPCIDGNPDAEAVRRDARSVAQRQHDALKAVCRSVLSSGELGRHRGLPVTTVITTTLRELEAGAGHAVGGEGSLLPITDLIRMAGHAHHYLAIFDDDGRALHLGRAKRIASEDQRIVLTAKDRGCTYPGCDRSAYHCQVHHMDEWAYGGKTDVDALTLSCEGHHKLLGPKDHHWRAIRGPDGRTWWIPPVHVDPARVPRINWFHHPDGYLRE
ncbi:MULTISPECIES: HNH endonuclease signature motif containing protein [unclassified Mycobacterium]|uniref:HNH endonuclease signature motif containing protein n=1 Tax=unclassified Mycobacterium TaxID=2642494 RepID=UPI0009944860|nr:MULTISPECIES: HNH endonuclease signature motif containing protein [unclassified Mycobacterium]